MEEFIRHKRSNRGVWKWHCKLYIPVPLSLKNRVVDQARANGMSQAEFGAVLISHCLDNAELLASAVKEYKALDEQLQQEFIDKMNAPQDRTFGGVFKSSFPRKEENHGDD